MFTIIDISTLFGTLFVHSRLNLCKYNQKRVHTETNLAYKPYIRTCFETQYVNFGI